MAVGQKSRKQKTSAGERRSSRPVRLTEVQKALLGKGVVDSREPVDCKVGWMGVMELRGPAAFPQQAAANRHLYPHLFSEQTRGRR